MNTSDKLREKAGDFRFYADGDPRAELTQRNLQLAAAYDVLADAWEAIQYGMPTDPQGAPHNYDCMGQHGYRCKCGAPALRRRIEEIAE